MQAEDEMRELVEESALAIGFSRRQDGTWLDSWGATFSGSPADIPPGDWSSTLRRAFEPSFGNRMFGLDRDFANAYRSSMTPKEVCELAIRLKGKK
jgi:hypothetical protein